MGRLIEKYIDQIFDERNVDLQTRQKLWAFYKGIFSAGITKAFRNKGNITIESGDLAELLKGDIAKFSAFKEDHFHEALIDLINKKAGAVPTRKEFKTEAIKLNELYNRTWLDTEFDMTVAKAQSALEWKDYEGRLHLYPNVRYIAVGDARTRPLHMAYDGLVLPFHHSFWTKHLPPWEYGCRCGTEQTDDDVLVPEGIDLDIKNKPGTGGNPAITGKIFENDHPYYQIGNGSTKDVEKRLEKFIDQEDYEMLRSNSGWEKAFDDIKRVKLEDKFPHVGAEELATLHDYTGSGYSRLNQTLFAGKTTDYFGAYERILNKTLEKLPVSEQKILFRGVRYNETIFKQYADNIGKEVMHGGFTSSSTEYAIANSFSGGDKMIFHIAHKSGRTVGEISAFSETFGSSSEYEVLFKSKTKFIVRGVEKIEDRYDIYLEEI